ncbi:MAG: hypothetical protein JXB06_07660 [Spirochaetales bacterium]|nr:hypothetical protein [Spirochaetales bacterium]
MSDSEGFQARLHGALEAKRRYLDESALPRLKESFQTFQSLFENLYNILLRKALVQEDPYTYEREISEIQIPSRTEILDLEKTEELSRRLSAFHAQLEFLNTYYHFSVDFIDLQRVRRIIALVHYIDWIHVTVSSPDATTAVLAQTLGKIRPGSDNISTGIISSSLAQMRELSRIILAQLKEILDFQKQAYKLMLRQELLPALSRTLGEIYTVSADKAYEKLRNAFAVTLKGKPFYRDLATELLQEEFAGDARQLRERSLEALDVPEQRPAKPERQQDSKSILLEAVRLMLPAGAHLEDALRKVVINREMLENSRRGLGGRLRSWLQKTFHTQEQSVRLEIRYFDARTSMTQTETIDFRKFVEGARRKSSLFEALSQPDSVSLARLREASEAQIDDFLNKNIGELQLLHRRLQGLGELFRQESPKEQIGQLKGIKIELSGLKNCIVRANRRRYEYTASKEAQMRLRQSEVTGQQV